MKFFTAEGSKLNLKAEIVNKIGKMMPIIKKGWGSRTRLKFGYSNRNAMIKPKKFRPKITVKSCVVK